MQSAYKEATAFAEEAVKRGWHLKTGYELRNGWTIHLQVPGVASVYLFEYEDAVAGRIWAMLLTANTGSDYITMRQELCPQPSVEAWRDAFASMRRAIDLRFIDRVVGAEWRLKQMSDEANTWARNTARFWEPRDRSEA